MRYIVILILFAGFISLQSQNTNPTSLKFDFKTADGVQKTDEELKYDYFPNDEFMIGWQWGADPKIAKELLNYNIPAYALVDGGKREQQIMIAGYKNHVGLYPHPTTIEKFKLELSDYTKGKGSVQFPLDKPLPKDLIIRMIDYRAELIKV